MMTIEPDEANRVLVIEMRGMISEADIDKALAELENRYPQVSVRLRGGTRGAIGVFADWEHLTGWERGAKTLGTITGKTLGDVVHKVAIVADAKWRDEVPRIADMGKQAEVRFFRVEDRDQAWRWITAAKS
jgi:stage II sporulation SpoAA-like protein